MVNVLWIAYIYPPDEFIGGIRPHRLAKYGRLLGINSFVLTHRSGTQSAPEENVYRAKKALFSDGVLRYRTAERASIKYGPRRSWRDKISHLSKSAIFFPDRDIYWFPAAYGLGKRICADHSIELVISTSPPASSHLLGLALKRKMKISWIADLRDLWTDNPLYYYGKIRRTLERRLENAVLKRADALVTVSGRMKRQLQAAYPHQEIFAVTNGYDPEDFPAPTADRGPGRLFKVLYTGQLYNGRRDPTTVFEALRALADTGEINGENFRLIFVGPDERFLKGIIREFRMEDIVKVVAPVPRQTSLAMQARAQVLLLISNYDPGTLTGKIFEYLAARRPILALAEKKSEIGAVLEETGAGRCCSGREEIIAFLRKHLLDWAAGMKAEPGLRDDPRAKYSYPGLAKRYADIIRKTRGRENAEY